MKTHFNTNWSELRNYCVKNEFYTRGTNQEYSDMFNLFGMISEADSFDEMASILERVARDILDHSEEENYILVSDYDDNLKEVMSELIETGAIIIYFD